MGSWPARRGQGEGWWRVFTVNLGNTPMTQSQISDDGKYARSGHALTWGLVAFAVAALAAAGVIGLVRTGGAPATGVADAIRSVIGALAGRPAAVLAQRESAGVEREGT